MPRLPVGLVLLALARCQGAPPPKPAAPPPPPPPKADLVLLTAKVLGTTVSGVAVKDGRIVALGDEAALQGWVDSKTEVLRLPKSAVLPGLVDAHMHFSGLGERRHGVDLVGSNSLEEVKGRVAAAVAKTPKGEWIRGRGWDQNDWATFKKSGLKWPEAKDLDQVAPDHPVVLRRIDGHALWANSLAMRLAEVDARTRSKVGGQIIKKKGRPSGVFVDNAMELIAAHVPPLSKDQRRQALLLARDECLAVGLTQVHDLGTDLETIELLRELDDANELVVRVYTAHDGMVEDLAKALKDGPRHASGTQRLTVRSVKFLIDGALGSRGAALLAPYADDPRNSGLLLLDDSLFEARVRSAHEQGFQVATHAIGDLGNRKVLDVYERVFGKDAPYARPRLEHAQVLHPDDLPRIGRLGVLASIQPTHATSDMPWAERRLGAERMVGAYAYRTLVDTASVAAGSDAPVEEASPIAGIYAAVYRKSLYGLPEEGWYPNQRLTVEQAIRAFSWGGAFASFREADAGSIEMGKIADLTVVDQDPLAANEDQLLGTKVLLTIIDGQIVYRRPGLTTATSTTAQ